MAYNCLVLLELKIVPHGMSISGILKRTTQRTIVLLDSFLVGMVWFMHLLESLIFFHVSPP